MNISMYDKIISVEEQLRKIALDEPEYAELWSTWELNKKTLEPVLGAIIKDYPHYSFHDHTHSESILSNIERALGNDGIEKLSPTDLWMLLHVAYLHDFGMVIADYKIREFWSTSEFESFLKEQMDSADEEMRKAATIVQSVNKREEYDKCWPLDVKAAVILLTSKYCRWQHGDFSRSYILDIKKIWDIDIGHNKLVKKRLVSLMADISVMHTRPFEEIFTLHKEVNGFFNDYVHPRLVASLLRWGDVLDLDNGRFNPYGEVIYGKMPDESKIHYGKHEATKHVLVTTKYIEVEADCPTDEIYRETRRWYDSLENEINSMHLRWSEIAPEVLSYPPKLRECRILRNGHEDSHKLTNLKFSISQKKAFEILEGSSIYKDKFSCIREIVQNAEDASKIQLWRDIKSGMYDSANGINRERVISGSLLPGDIPEWIYQIYSIKVIVEKNEKNNAVVSIEDHGTGISSETLREICNVGQSYFQKKTRQKEVEEMPVWMRPTATFGIGLQSCFLASDKIEIFTNTDKDGAFKLTFQSGRQEGYVNVEEIQNYIRRGSKVVLEIDNTINFTYDMFGFTHENLMEIEPFESNCIVIYKVIESIFKECESSFFEINVSSETVRFEQIISPATVSRENFPKTNHKNKFLYSLSANQKTLIAWYKNSLYKITMDEKCDGALSVKFKGKNIRNHRIHSGAFPGLCIEIDMYGRSTKDTLTLSREELKREVVIELGQEIEDIISGYIDILLENIDKIRENVDIVDVVLLLAWKYNKHFPETLKGCLSNEKSIKVLKFDLDENKYTPKDISLSELAKYYPQVPHIKRNVTLQKVDWEDTLDQNELCNLLTGSNFDKEKFSCILIDRKIKNFLQSGYYDSTYVEADKEIELCTVNLNREIYEPDKYTRKQLIRKLVYQKVGGLYNSGFKTRRAIPAIDSYEKIAVELRNIIGIGFDCRSKWKIISPISLEDAKKITDFSEGGFVEYITGRNTFKNLVDYTMENRKEKDTGNREAVIEDYKRLIQEYYNLILTTEHED